MENLASLPKRGDGYSFVRLQYILPLQQHIHTAYWHCICAVVWRYVSLNYQFSDAWCNLLRLSLVSTSELHVHIAASSTIDTVGLYHSSMTFLSGKGITLLVMSKTLCSYWQGATDECFPASYLKSVTDIHVGQTYTYYIVMVGGCLVAVAQWQSTGCTSQRCPGFHSWRLTAFSLSSIFAS